MKSFLDEDFLLSTETARALYHGAAEGMPIIDYHCHLSPREIWENRPFQNMTRLWLGGDHYKWRLMRWAGVEEDLITGSAPDWEKFLAWARVLGRAIGNPLYHWSHLELSRFFGITEPLNERSAPAIWDGCNRALEQPGFTPRSLILRSGVETLCTTDDPADSLEYHEALGLDADFRVNVLPAWRPDRALNIDQEDFPAYIRRLEAASGMGIFSYGDLKRALENRMDFFHARGCRLSDHALGSPACEIVPEAALDAIFRARLAGKTPSPAEASAYRAGLLLFLGAEYRRRGWVMQLHMGALRNNNPRMFRALGPDTGYDAIDDGPASADLAKLLAAFGEELPRTILYSLNGNMDSALLSVVGCFQGGGSLPRIQQGSAWWFNDHLDGMEHQLRALAAQGYLAGFLGMLTDSRSFLSYPRHEYFRRIFCNLLGSWVEEGLYPPDMDELCGIVRQVCYENAKTYFAFPEK